MEPKERSWRGQRVLTREMLAHQRTMQVSGRERGRFTIYRRPTPWAGVEAARWHVFACDGEHEAREAALPQAVSYDDRPEGFESKEEAVEYVLHKMAGRKVYWLGLGRAHLIDK